MKVVWEAGDIKTGLRVNHPIREEQWIIRYRPDPSDMYDEIKNYYLVSLSDGMIAYYDMTAEKIADHLTVCGLLPQQLIQT